MNLKKQHVLLLAPAILLSTVLLTSQPTYADELEAKADTILVTKEKTVIPSAETVELPKVKTDQGLEIKPVETDTNLQPNSTATNKSTDSKMTEETGEKAFLEPNEETLKKGKQIPSKPASLKEIDGEANLTAPAATITTSQTHIIGDTYPWKGQTEDNGYDPYGYALGNCTSFVAHRLDTVNKIRLDAGYGNAGTWGTVAQSRGYAVNHTPAIGSVAWFGPYAGGALESGHVSWVAGIENGKVILEEYNVWPNVHAYNVRKVDSSQVTGFIHFKDLKTSDSPSPKPIETPAPTTPKKSELPNQGTYHFTGYSGVKAEPKITSPDLAQYEKGMSVIYDKTLKANGYQWISYIASSGKRRYIAVAQLPENKPSQPKPVTKPTPNFPKIAERGYYVFTGHASVTAEAKVGSPELAFYEAGNGVSYDRVLIADGHQWISYIAVSGKRRFIMIH